MSAPDVATDEAALIASRRELSRLRGIAKRASEQDVIASIIWSEITASAAEEYRDLTDEQRDAWGIVAEAVADYLLGEGVARR